MKKIQLGIKRFFDLFVSALMILVLIAIPVLIVIPLAVKLTSKGPVIFKQKRIGKGGKEFDIYKFRSMLIPEERIDENGNMREPQDSITKVGAFLRRTSLDELPQLFNILKGDMSIVGPRPMIPYRAALISAEQNAARHTMRPGITGLAQVNGRNDLSWDQKVAYDMQYVENFSLGLDLSILLKTIKVVLLHKGIEYIPDK